MQRQLSHPPDETGATIFEMIVSMAIVVVIFLGALDWLTVMNRAVKTNTDRVTNNAAAQRAIDQMDVNIRFATNVVVCPAAGCRQASSGNPVGVQLFVTNGPQKCTEWYQSGSNLVEQMSSGSSTIVTAGVSNLSFAGNSAYNGLISVSFTLNQSNSQTDPDGVTVDESFAASNMATAVGSSSPCTFPN